MDGLRRCDAEDVDIRDTEWYSKGVKVIKDSILHAQTWISVARLNPHYADYLDSILDTLEVDRYIKRERRGCLEWVIPVGDDERIRAEKRWIEMCGDTSNSSLFNTI